MSQPSGASSTSELTSTDLIKSKTGREELKYLASCALNKNQEIYATHEGEKYVFKGSMGLAPNWLSKGLNDEQQRWISACMFARTNYFGQKIQISMRSDNSQIEYLKSDEEEKKSFSIFEAGFFGNIFLEHPVAYVCQGDDIEMNDDILKWRICAKTSLQTKFSMCNFIIVGKCSDKKSFEIEGQEYKEIIKVYLKPGLSSLQK